jgi:hypothetical protein
LKKVAANVKIAAAQNVANMQITIFGISIINTLDRSQFWKRVLNIGILTIMVNANEIDPYSDDLDF